MIYFRIIVLCSIFIHFNDCSRILAIFPMPAISHQSAFRPITQELARRGHEVTVITPNPAFSKDETPKNFREIDVHDITYEAWRKLISNLPEGNNDGLYLQLKMILHFIIKYVEMQILSPDVQDLINNNNVTFDLILSEHCTRPALVFSHIYNVPVIEISSFGSMHGKIFASLGAPSHPILYPTCMHQRLFNLTMWEKINAFYNYYVLSNLIDEYEAEEDAMIKKIVGEDTPSVSELKNNVAMVFLNVHPIWEDNRPVPPNVIYMGGVHQKPEKELPQDYKSYLDASKHGVIYFSLGTSVHPSQLPRDKIQVMLNVFSKLPYDVLWKYDKEDLPGKPSNVRIEKWIPQADLLRHPKIKLFITQGGLQSTDEAITAGVPMVTIPMLGDQWFNAERQVYHKIAIQLNLHTMTEDIFKNAINTIIEDESYRRNIDKLRQVMHDEPQSPVERAVWWTEHVLRHGGAEHLRSPAANMSWTQYYEIQLLLLLLAGLVTALSIVVFIVYTLLRLISSNFVNIKIKNIGKED
ncbi:UDP-glucosyltransferase 2 [Manduca sexta]|uniref:UDP-glucuronosyltransferase n=1 Tax=Manduca sexta TaxID=7130 RepID=A0A921ZMW6_MANSE|nr:UDP-glucosyltransferase 2 [Manduca sexta]KAG6460585.1 UDP-glycosyltransferase [Manduca sexta]